MLIAPMLPVAEAAVFTLGCVLIQTQRHRAEQLTSVLAVVLVVSLLSIAILATPEKQINLIAEATALAEMGASIPLRPK